MRSRRAPCLPSMTRNVCVSSRLKTCSRRLNTSRAVGIGDGGGKVVSIVNGIDRRQGIAGGEKLVQPRVPKSSRIVCRGLLKTCAMPLKSGAPAGGVGHKFSSGWTLGDGGGARSGIRNKSRGGLVQALAKSFVIAEQESLVHSNRSAERGAKLVALERAARIPDQSSWGRRDRCCEETRKRCRAVGWFPTG